MAVNSRRRAGRVALLALAAMAGPFVGSLVAAFASGPTGFNDFHDYWLAGRLVAASGSPYDLAALRALAARQDVPFLVGGGYSYPAPFALLMVPLAGLPFPTAVLLFEVASFFVFGLAVAGWLEWSRPSAPLRGAILAAGLAGLYPPVVGSAAVGQANLLLLAPLAAGAALLVTRATALRARSTLGGALLGLVAVVKLVPGVAIVPLGLAGRWRAAAGLVLGVAIPLALAGAIAPNAFAGSGALGELFAPDAYFTNSSINGFVSRFVISSDRFSAIVPGAFDPRLPTLALTAALAIATLVVLWRARNSLGEARGLARGLGFSIVAATIGAPKTSFWNESFVLVAVALVFVAQPADLRLRGRDRVDRALLAGWVIGTTIQPLAWIAPLAPGSFVAAFATLLGSASTFGLLALWWLFARRLETGRIGVEVLPGPDRTGPGRYPPTGGSTR